MPDISMCPSETCPVRHDCYRNAASGTRPTEWRQAYMDFGSRGEPCDAYWPLHRADVMPRVEAERAAASDHGGGA